MRHIRGSREQARKAMAALPLGMDILQLGSFFFLQKKKKKKLKVILLWDCTVNAPRAPFTQCQASHNAGLHTCALSTCIGQPIHLNGLPYA